jgi:hypothetical protein
VVDFIGYFFLKLSRDDILETLSFSAPGCRRKESTANLFRHLARADGHD